MDKLLHERLREFVSEPWRCPVRNFSICDSYTPFIQLTKNDAQALADEIERYYIPLPRFEDGEPVPLGTEIEWADYTTRSITGFGVTPYGKPYITCAFDGKGISDAWMYGEYIERQRTKVLDADGVEIRVGDTVWSVQNGKKAVVSAIGQLETEYSKGNVMLEGASECYKGTLFTHREPVLDEDGVPIKVGDTLWATISGRVERCIVEGFTDGGCVDVLFEPDYAPSRLSQKCLTRKEPDSLEKLRDDMEWHVKEKTVSPYPTIKNFADRLSALIERGA